ncbi:MAG: hypothetical protein ACTS77_04605 [Arsenophonus sp. NC-TX2-MAG3]
MIQQPGVNNGWSNASNFSVAFQKFLGKQFDSVSCRQQLITDKLLLLLIIIKHC